LSAIDLELMRASMLLDTDPAAAARDAGAVLLNHPGHDAASLLLSAACRRLGNSSGVIDVIEALARAQPASAVVQLELGRTYAACGRIGDANSALERAVKLDGNLPDAWRRPIRPTAATDDWPPIRRISRMPMRLSIKIA
jgi:predicted Zn-dependent protease